MQAHTRLLCYLQDFSNTKKFNSANAGSVLRVFFLSSKISARFVGQQADPRQFAEDIKKRQNPSEASRQNAEEGVNKLRCEGMTPDSEEG